MKKIAIIGTGYVGLVTGTCLSDIGHEVTCVDINEKRISLLQDGHCPLHEPGLSAIIESNMEEKRLRFTSDVKEAVRTADAIFIAVGTPEKNDGSADLTYLKAAVISLSESIKDGALVIIKSTVPPGTNRKVREWLLSETESSFHVLSNPEFLREGSAVNDFFYGDRIVIGGTHAEASQKLEQIYSSLHVPVLHTDPVSAEMIKYASNAFLATKISFINEIAGVCERLGADITQVSQGMGMDKRIGEQFLRAGMGFGGSCFPKDSKALIQVATDAGLPFPLVSTVLDVNERQKRMLVEKAKQRFGTLEGKKVAVLGLAFKPNTDDIRESPAVAVIQQLLQEGAVPVAYDPVIKHSPFGPVTDSIRDALSGADAAMICTEWPSISELPLDVYATWMKEPIVFDGRNCYSRNDWEGKKLEYHSIGRETYRGCL